MEHLEQEPPLISIDDSDMLHNDEFDEYKETTQTFIYSEMII